MEKMIFKSQTDGQIEDVLLEKGFKHGRILKFLKNKDIRVNGEKIASNVTIQIGDEKVFVKKPNIMPCIGLTAIQLVS